MDAALLHCLNHVAVAAARVKKTNDLLKARETNDPPRDQGFVRPSLSTELRVRPRLAAVMGVTAAIALASLGRALRAGTDRSAHRSES